ncbi:MAG TPA: glycosyltransferase [Pyrinomonadaceae bacterium]|jgi:glycosyltransferase involved in cell wall biosynthesis|nr:glycosyltransferase [Pyrinomonadaceae bacterium]
MQLPVTVIIPTFNRLQWIAVCLDSIKRQTYPHIETLVIDDGSTDGTVEWLKSQPDYSFVRVHEQPKNGGASVARNDGIRLAQGELITFIDSDDALLPNHVETAINIFRNHPQTGLFCCDSTIIDSEGQVLFDGRTWHQIQSELRKHPVQSGFRSLSNIFEFSHIFPGFTLPKAVFEKIGYFDQSIFPMDDYDLSLRVAGAGYGVYYCNEPLALRREHTGQCSGVANSIDTCRKQMRALYAALQRNPELWNDSPAIKRRLASAKLELALSRMNAGEKAGGLGTLLDALATDPGQLFRVAHLGRRRLRRLVASA